MNKAREEKIRQKNRAKYLKKLRLKRQFPEKHKKKQMKKLKQKDPEKYKIEKRKEVRDKQRIAMAKNPEKYKDYQLARKYRISLEEYGQLLDSQGGGCAICGGKQKSEKLKFFSVDHDHKCCPGKKTCGKCTRGLLCNRCNTGIGAFNDDPSLLQKAILYLSSSLPKSSHNDLTYTEWRAMLCLCEAEKLTWGREKEKLSLTNPVRVLE